MSGAARGAGGDGSRRSVSTLLGCGCAALITVFMLFVVATTFLTYRAGKRLAEMADDPRAAEAAVREVLPYDELPAGYAPRGTLSVPLVMDVAFLGGPGAPDDERSFENGFVYVRVRDWFGRGDRSRQWLAGGEGDEAPIEQEQLVFRPEEVVARGELTVDGARVTWSARRGEVEIDLGQGDEPEEGGASGAEAEVRVEAQEGVLALFAVGCGDGDGDGWERLAMWFVPDPAPGAPATEIDWTGTPADPAAIEGFLARFDLCASP